MTIIAVSGVPGTGKSTLSSSLYAHFSALSMHDPEKYGIWKEYDVKKMISDEKLYDSIDPDGTMVVDQKKLIKCLISHIDADSMYNIVIDSFFSHLLPSSVVDICVICCCDISVLNKRLSQRGYSVEKVRENVDCEIIDYCGQEAQEMGHNVVYFDSSKEDAKQFIRKIDSIIFS